MHICISQQYTLYDRNRKNTIVIIMRDWQILLLLMDILYKLSQKGREALTSV